MYVNTYMRPRQFCFFLNILVLPALVASSQTLPAPSSMPQGPTTRVLAIGHLTAGSTRDKIMPVMREEVRDTVRLYLAGKLDQWFVRRDQNGVVFILNAANVTEARTLLEKLPLGQAKLMEFDLIPLGPLTPLGLLLNDKAAAEK